MNKTLLQKGWYQFPIVNLPFMWSNIPAASTYGPYISLLIRYSRSCGSSQDFLDRGLLLTMRLLKQWFLVVMLESSFRNFTVNISDHDLVIYYRISLSQICSVCRSHNLVILSSFMTFHQILTRVTRHVSVMEQELLTFLEDTSSTLVLVKLIFV
jgi:hypothetical protein